MPDHEALPIGRLNDVKRSWDFQGGWVRAPFYEIMFNNRLTKQARLLWLWLSWVRPESRNISWADCEETMCCGTKARRLCLAQLVQEGFVTVEDNGVVVLHDPYEIYRQTHTEVIPKIEREFQYQACNDKDAVSKEQPIVTVTKVEVIKETQQDHQEPKVSVEKEKKSEIVAAIISTWNEAKPDSYSKIRTVSGKQLEAVGKHLKNLSLKQKDLQMFLRSVCLGISRSDFWSNRVDASGRNFSAVFGYGNPHDVKLKNVENLFMLGQDEGEPQETIDNLDENQKELIKTYKYISFEYEKARNRNNQAEMNKWKQNLESIQSQLTEMNISMEAHS